MAEDDDFVRFAQRMNDLGEGAVRAMLENRQFNDRHERQARIWLAARDEVRMTAREERADRSLTAAERSAAAAGVAAVNAERSASWTMWAALISLIAVLVSVLPGFLSWLLNR